MRDSFARTLLLSILCCALAPSAFAQLAQTLRPQGTAADAAWRSLYLADIAFLRDLVQRNYIYAVYAEGDPQWQKRLARAARFAGDDTGKVRDFGSYRAALQHYIAAFEDAHFSAYFSVGSDAAQWPGFSLRYGAGRYLVARSAIADVTVGAQVSACDGEPIESWLDRLAEFYGGPRGRETTRAAIAPQLFVDRGNPLYSLPRTCVVSGESLALTWRPVPTALSAGPDRAPVRTGAAVSTLDDQALALEEFGDDGAWVRIGTMMPSSRDQAESFQRLIDAAPGLRSKSFVVLDVRGNPGGTYNWFMAFLRGLYGTGYADHYATARLEISNVVFTPAGESQNAPSGLASETQQPVTPPDPPMISTRPPRVERVSSGGQLVIMVPAIKRRSAPAAAPASLYALSRSIVARYGDARRSSIGRLADGFPTAQRARRHPARAHGARRACAR